MKFVITFMAWGKIHIIKYKGMIYYKFNYQEIPNSYQVLRIRRPTVNYIELISVHLSYSNM